MLIIFRLLSTLALVIYALYSFFVSAIMSAQFYGEENTIFEKNTSLSMAIIGLLSIVMIFLIYKYRCNRRALLIFTLLYSILLFTLSTLALRNADAFHGNTRNLHEMITEEAGYYMALATITILLSLLVTFSGTNIDNQSK